MDELIHLLFTVEIPHPLQKLSWAGAYYQCMCLLWKSISCTHLQNSVYLWVICLLCNKEDLFSVCFSLLDFKKLMIIQLPSNLKITE